MDTRGGGGGGGESHLVSLSDETNALGSAFLFLERADSSSPAPKPEVPCPGYERRERVGASQCVRVRPRGVEKSCVCAEVVVGDVRTRRATESRAWTTTGRRRRRRRRRRCRRRCGRSWPSTRLFSASSPSRLLRPSVASGLPTCGRARRDRPRLISLGSGISDGSECRIVLVVRHDRPRRRDAPRSTSGSGSRQAKIAVSTRDRIDECDKRRSIDRPPPIVLSPLLPLLSISIVTGERRFSSSFREKFARAEFYE